jgi:hypothetical protein
LCLVVLSVAIALFWFAWTVLLWSRWHPAMPWRDLFVVLDDLRPMLEGGSLQGGWLSLLEPHYAAHRIALPRALVALDMLFFGGGNGPLYVAGWLGMATILLLYARLARDGLDGDWPLLVLVCSVAVTWMFAPAHFWNIANAVNASWHLCFALAALAFVLLLNDRAPPSAVRWVSAYLLTSLAALTTFAGVIAWLLLPLLAPRGNWRLLALTAAVSIALTILYTGGLASDAQIAARWDTGDPAAASIREAGEAAIAANDPVRMVQKAVVLLCWPLSAEYPLLAALIFALSLIPVVIYGWQWVLGWLGRGPALQRWQEFCLLFTAMAVGVALAVQLGRVIEQPNYAHGPSYERYNTVVAIYWMGVTGLVAGVISARSALRRAASAAAILVLVLLLIAPGGTYLQQEIASLETAARLYAAGEKPALREEVDRKLLRFKPEYVFSFDALFQRRALAYTRPTDLPPGTDGGETCSSRRVRFESVESPRAGLTGIRVRIEGAVALPVRDVLLSDDGALYARLYPVHEGSFTPLALLAPGQNAWTGLVESRSFPPRDLHVSLQLLGWPSFGCMLPAQAWNVSP